MFEANMDLIFLIRSFYLLVAAAVFSPCSPISPFFACIVMLLPAVLRSPCYALRVSRAPALIDETKLRIG
jgi:hypothetical protein